MIVTIELIKHKANDKTKIEFTHKIQVGKIIQYEKKTITVATVCN